MDSDTLVDGAIADGARFLERLQLSGFPVLGAAWVRFSDTGRWRFFIVTPLVDTDGHAATYRRFHPILFATPSLPSIALLTTALAGPSSPLGKDLLQIYQQWPGPWPEPLRRTDFWLGDRRIETAYVYPLPSAVTG